MNNPVSAPKLRINLARVVVLLGVSMLLQACLADPTPYFASRDYQRFSVTFTGVVTLDTNEPVEGAEVIQMLVEGSPMTDWVKSLPQQDGGVDDGDLEQEPGDRDGGVADADTEGADDDDDGGGGSEDRGDTNGEQEPGPGDGSQPEPEEEGESPYVPVPVYGARTTTDSTGSYTLTINLAVPGDSPETLSFVLRATHPVMGTQDKQFSGENGTTVTADFTLISGTRTN